MKERKKRERKNLVSIQIYWRQKILKQASLARMLKIKLLSSMLVHTVTQYLKVSMPHAMKEVSHNKAAIFHL